MDSRLAADYHSLARPLRDNLRMLAPGAQELLIKRLRWTWHLGDSANHLGLRGHVLDTKFGPRCDATQLLVLTRIREDVSAGKCVAAMISRPRIPTSVLFQVIPASASIAHLLHRARMPWILDSWLWDVPKIPWRTSTSLDHQAGNERCF